MEKSNGRLIGIVHRVKQTAANEARPTMVAISRGSKKPLEYKLETETDELDFLLGRFPTKWRPVKDGEDLTSFPTHHIDRDKKTREPKRVPVAYGGYCSGDTVLMALGGSGDRLAYALTRQGLTIGGEVWRIKPAELKIERSVRQAEKQNDHVLLLELFAVKPELFQETVLRDLDLIELREAFYSRQEAQRARIACEQRLRQRVIGQIFLSKEGKYPEGSIEDLYDAAKANDQILGVLDKEESRREADLKKIMHKLAIWQTVFEPIEGCGEILAARLISAIGDIRRFGREASLKKFCGVAVMPDGSFPRRRYGQVASWQPDARQALFLLGDQFVRRKNSVWGKKLIDYKRILRERHPSVVEERNGSGKLVKRYTDGHIHKMAIWRTVTKFVEWLYGEWTRAEMTGPASEAKAA